MQRGANPGGPLDRRTCPPGWRGHTRGMGGGQVDGPSPGTPGGRTLLWEQGGMLGPITFLMDTDVATFT